MKIKKIWGTLGSWASGVLSVVSGGTGAATLTDHGVLVGSGTGAVTPLSVGTNGQVLLGSTGTDPVFATVTDGEGITTTLGAGTLQIDCEDASDTNKGISELATVAETITGTDTARTTTPEGVAGALAVQTNPKAMAQAVHLTESSTVGGITVADNANVDFGTGNCSFFWKGSLPDWQGDGNYYQFISRPSVSGYLYFGLDPVDTTSGKLRANRNGAAATSTIAPSLTDKQNAMVGVVFSGDTATFYVNGKQIGDAVACVANALDSADAYYISAYSATGRKESDTESVYFFNRALTASEVSDLYLLGIAFADKWGSQTEQTSGTLTIGKRYRINNWITDDDFTNVGGANVDGTEFVATGTTPTKWTNSSTVVPAGATLALESEGIQTDKWYDSSSNGLNATYPASGSSLTRQRRDVLFSAYLSATATNVTGAGTTYNIVCDTEEFDVGGNFASGIFTAPYTGYYHFDVMATSTGMSNDETAMQVYLLAGTKYYINDEQPTSFKASGQHVGKVNENVYLTKGQTAQPQIRVAGGDTDTCDVLGHATSRYTSFSGYLINTP